MESAMYALFLKLLEHPEFANRYRGQLPCSMLAALGLEDDENPETISHAPLLWVLNS
jgi:hypothetical protein